MKYKVGDRVKVISNISDHYFEIGSIVEVRSLDSNGDIWDCQKLDGSDYWCIENDEVEPISPSPDYRALYEQEKAIIEQIKSAFSRYVKTEGCGCCQDTIGHKEAEKRLAELLNPEPYEDGSGWKWY